jgi:hypothetical protein
MLLDGRLTVPRSTKQQTQDGPDLFDLLDEIEHGPSACPHVYAVGKNGSGWVVETAPDSPYFREWVHSDPACRRSAVPGGSRAPVPTMGWSRELQKDVPL